MLKYIQNMGWMLLPDKVIKLDKQAHFVGGFYFGGLAYILLMALFVSKPISFFGGIFMAYIVGHLKEHADSLRKDGKGKFDLADLFVTILGGIVACVVLLIIYKY